MEVDGSADFLDFNWVMFRFNMWIFRGCTTQPLTQPTKADDTWNELHQKLMLKKQDMKKNGATRRTPGDWSPRGLLAVSRAQRGPPIWEIPDYKPYKTRVFLGFLIPKNPLMVVVGWTIFFQAERW